MMNGMEWDCQERPAADTMPESTRTFIAIAIPEPMDRQLGGLQAELAPEVPGCRWTSGGPFHITLAFLGDVRNPHLSQVCDAVAASATSIEPFAIEVGGLGAFPNSRRPRVIWAGVTAPEPKPLFDLQASIAGAAIRAGYRPGDERFHPHVTLGRLKHDRQRALDVTGLIARHHLWSAGAFRVEEVVVFASTLGSAGPHYEVRGRGLLGGKKTEARP